ncbi:hypothetical protein BYT27DRAFT_7180661 [Phlegmacium glaucopus]|nr:hypothetical protein BYT27DRAFT_7180661 [Phlegmacium glaucopus]
MAMQRATITGLRIRSPADARVIFYSVFLNILPMVTRRLDTEERSLISTGSVYVWEERGPHAELTGVGIERWTDGIRWGPSRVREGFLFYHEKPTSQQLFSQNMSHPNHDPSRSFLIKQTYTVFVDTPKGQRKWHLIAYFTEDTVNGLRSIDDIPQLASLSVPHGKFKSARSVKGRTDHIFNPESDSQGFPRLEYVPHAPGTSPSISPTSPAPEDTWPDNPVASKYEPTPVTPTSHYSGKAPSASETLKESLVPLHYLQDNAPPRRDPMDEKILMLLNTHSFQADDPQRRFGTSRPMFEG